MANGKKGDGARSSKNAVRRKAAPPAELTNPVRTVQSVSRLCRKMATTPDVETARELRFRANELETFFAGIRRNTHEYIEATVSELEAETKRKAALEALGKVFTAPEASGLQQIESPLAQSPLAPDDAGASHEERFAMLMNSPQASAFRASLVGPEMAAAAPMDAMAQPTAVGTDQGTPLDLGDFFQQVSKAMIDAQQTLDSMSLQYALQQHNAAMPGALYSIPTVKAEIKAGLSNKSGSGLLVSLFKDDSSTSYSDSTISFDVVASPPPPGRLDRFTSPIPKFLVVEGDDRKEVLDAVAASVSPPTETGWADRTVVVRDLSAGRDIKGKRAFFALTPGPQPQPTAAGTVDFSNVSLSLNLFEEPGPVTTIIVPAGPLPHFWSVWRSVSGSG